MKIPFISDQEILETISPVMAVEAIEQAFIDYDDLKNRMPEKVYLDLPEFKGDFRAMPAYSERHNLAAVKWVNSHSENIGLPAVMAHMIVNDPKTGEVKAIFEATKLTAYRTGAASAVAAKYLSSESIEKVAFIGAGVQAYFQLLCLDVVRDIKKASVVDLSEKNMNLFKEFAQDLSIEVDRHSSIDRALENADIVISTTPSKKAIIFDKHLNEGVHINAIGADAPGKQECDISVLKSAHVIVDDRAQSIHSGEINNAIRKKVYSDKDIAASLGEVIKKRIKINKQEKTLFDSTGLAIQDLALAGLFLNIKS